MGGAHTSGPSRGSTRLRLAWFGAVVFVAVFGAGAFASWIVESVRGESWWAIDLTLVLDAARRLGAGEPLYGDPKFLYPPLAAVVATPLLAVDGFALSLVYAVLKAILAVAGVLALTARRGPADRALAAVALVLSLPFLHDVFLGNANAVLVATMALAAYGPNRARHGILLGLAAAIVAKPFLVPFGLWLLVARRPVLAGTLASGAAATAFGVALTGIPAYSDWVRALVAGGRYAAPFAGNHGITALWPAAWAPVAAVTAVALVVVLLRARPTASLVWAATAGILLAPYAGTYSALPIALAMPSLVALSPWFAVAIVAVSPLATTHPLPFYAASIMLGSLALGRRVRPAEPPSRPASTP
jgi:hypothetical protein